MDDGHYSYAIQKLKGCLRSLPPNVRTVTDPFIDRIREALEMAQHAGGPDSYEKKFNQRMAYMRFVEPICYEALGTIWGTLFTKGYITKSGYGERIDEEDWTKAVIQ